MTPAQAKQRILEWGEQPWFEQGEVKARLLTGAGSGLVLGVVAAGAALTFISLRRPKGRAVVGGLLRSLLQPGIITAVLPILLDAWASKARDARSAAPGISGA